MFSSSVVVMESEGIHISSKCKRRFKKYRPILKKLAKGKKVDLKEDELVRCISECCLNIVKGIVPIGDKEYQKLKRKRIILEKICKSYKCPWEKHKRKNRKVINQEGGGLLPLVLGPVLKLLAGVLI